MEFRVVKKGVQKTQGLLFINADFSLTQYKSILHPPNQDVYKRQVQ